MLIETLSFRFPYYLFIPVSVPKPKDDKLAIKKRVTPSCDKFGAYTTNLGKENIRSIRKILPDNKRKLIEQRQKKIKDSSLKNITPNVMKNFKKYAEQFIPYDFTNKDMTKEQKIEHVLRSFGLMVQTAHTFEGYSSDTFLRKKLATVWQYHL